METTAHIKQWFELAVPAPTDKNRAVQLGVHFEEVEEMMTPLGLPLSIREPMLRISHKLKTEMAVSLDDIDREAKVLLLDALCDQVVTAIGVAHMFGFNIAGALAEVNASNWSKFKDGKPIFDANGKIAKNLETYRKPDLSRFVPEDITDAQVK